VDETFRLLTVIFIENGKPARSLLISFVTSDEGDFVGKGPAVSVGDMLHEPDDVPPSVPEPVPDSIVSVRSLLLHEPTSGVTAAKPKAAMMPFFKKAFLSI
jgi:hypothetical protein